jgi:hypothetical protein
MMRVPVDGALRFPGLWMVTMALALSIVVPSIGAPAIENYGARFLREFRHLSGGIYTPYISDPSTELRDSESILKKLDAHDLSWHFAGDKEGVFGSVPRRITFKLKVRKDRHRSNRYLVTGTDQLGANVRLVEGFIQIEKVARVRPTENEVKRKGVVTYILLARYELREPGDKAGDGVFYGYASMIDEFDARTLKPGEILFASDFSDFQSPFVGNWKNFKTGRTEKSVFDHSACCTTPLPYCEELYDRVSDPDADDFGFIRIRPQYQKEWPVE